MAYNSGIYYNPASAYIRNRIADGAAEIAEKYDVDGIHFDDYFYPTDDESIDAEQYTAYVKETEEPLTLHEWRTANVNALIAAVYSRVKEANENVQFGISPQGNLENNEMINADVYTCLLYTSWSACSRSLRRCRTVHVRLPVPSGLPQRHVPSV